MLSDNQKAETNLVLMAFYIYWKLMVQCSVYYPLSGLLTQVLNFVNEQLLTLVFKNTLEAKSISHFVTPVHITLFNLYYLIGLNVIPKNDPIVVQILQGLFVAKCMFFFLGFMGFSRWIHFCRTFNVACNKYYFYTISEALGICSSSSSKSFVLASLLFQSKMQKEVCKTFF